MTPRGALESRLFAPSTSRQGPAHGVLRDRTPEPLLDRPMHVRTMHRTTGDHQHLDDGPLHDTVAKPPRRRLHGDRPLQPRRPSQRASLRLEHRRQGPGGFERCPTKCMGRFGPSAEPPSACIRPCRNAGLLTYDSVSPAPIGSCCGNTRDLVVRPTPLGVLLSRSRSSRVVARAGV
jgi:hypothetical protein